MTLTSPETTSASPAAPIPPSDLDAFAHHWQDEADAAYLYRVLSVAERDPRKRDLYQRLSHVEERHTKIWGDLLAANGRRPGPFHPSLRARVMALLGRAFGHLVLCPRHGYAPAFSVMVLFSMRFSGFAFSTMRCT